MNCEEARLHIGADPDDSPPELLAHLETCAQCRTYREEMQTLNAKIRRALELNIPDSRKFEPPAAPTGTVATGVSTNAPATQASAPIPSNVTVLPRRSSAPPVVPKQKRPRLMAFAASVIGASVIALTLWLSRPTESLAGEIIKHVEGEPNSWSRTEPVTEERLIAVLRQSNVRLGPGAPSIVYANSCWFRGHFVPHLVVTTPDGPVTVLILINENVSAPSRFDEEGFSGLLVPAPTGSVAVLSRSPMPLEQPASAMIKALQAAR
jgi:Protein of unknown function (DUF3379)